MPYIPADAREPIDKVLALLEGRMVSSGDLNFTVTRLISIVIDYRGGPTYTNINVAVGVLECAKLELYRRVAAPYEDRKQQLHGDVY